MNKHGIILLLVGIGLFLISIFSSSGYVGRRSLMSDMYNMEVVICEGESRWEDGKVAGRHTIPLSFLLSLSIIIILTGIGIILLSKK